MVSCWTEMGPKSNDKHPSKRQKGDDSETQRGRPCEDGNRNRMLYLQAKEC